MADAPPKRKRGRPRGSRTKRRLQLRMTDKGITPLEYLLSVVRNTHANADRRMKAAQAAAPYCHERLATITHKGNALNLTALLAGMTSDEFAAFEQFAGVVARLHAERSATGDSRGEATTTH